MFKKEIIFFVICTFLITSCADDWASVKRGITGEKKKSTDEFFIQKKDPLILPPDFESLPTPSEGEGAVEKMTSIEKKLKKVSGDTTTSASVGSSAEDSILKQIRKK